MVCSNVVYRGGGGVQAIDTVQDGGKEGWRMRVGVRKEGGWG